MSEFDQIWVMKNGTKLKVCDMEPLHVRNTIKLVIRSIMQRVLSLGVNIRHCYPMNEIDNMTEYDARKMLNEFLIDCKPLKVKVFKALCPNNEEWYKELGIL